MSGDKKINSSKEEITPEQRKSVLTTFIILFPSLLITCLISYFGVLPVSMIAIALFFYQAVLLKNFVGDYYSK